MEVSGIGAESVLQLPMNLWDGKTNCIHDDEGVSILFGQCTPVIPTAVRFRTPCISHRAYGSVQLESLPLFAPWEHLWVFSSVTTFYECLCDFQADTCVFFHHPISWNISSKYVFLSIFILCGHFIYFYFVFIYLLFRASSMAYGSSQARGWIGAAATGLHHSHSNAGSELHLRPTPQLPATLDP